MYFDRKSYSTNKNDVDDSDSESDVDSGCCSTTSRDTIGAPLAIVFLLLALWIVLGVFALVFHDIDSLSQKWSYVDAVVYVFTTLTTVGYASRQPNFPINSTEGHTDLVHFILYVLYIWFGMVLVASLIRLVFLVIDRFFKRKLHQDNDEVTY